MIEGPERIERLAARVRWLDRYHRYVAMAVGLVAALIVVVQLSKDWPWVHAVGLFAAATFVGWWVTELAVAWMMALWETECEQWSRDRGLPKAILRK